MMSHKTPNLSDGLQGGAIVILDLEGARSMDRSDVGAQGRNNQSRFRIRNEHEGSAERIR
jgi:hypothetical protein